MSRRDHECDDGTQSWSLSYSRFGSFKRSTGGEGDTYPAAEEVLPEAEAESKRETEKDPSK